MNAPSERNSPMSSSETLSGSSSPQVLRLVNVPVQTKKQRSSSMNSIGSNHSTQQRSMSINSLELPRNSIVSIDDNFLRATRNNSSASLTSLAPLVSPNETTKDNYVSHRLSKFRPKNSSAVMSDDDSESENTPSRFKWRRSSSDKVLKPTFLSSLKKDFKFRYDNHCTPKVSSAHPSSKGLDDSIPSPLSLTTDASSYPTHHHHHHHMSPTSHLHHLQHAPDSELDPLPMPPRPIGSGKKMRTSSITQSIFLKKRLLLSKDIQLELLGTHNQLPSGTYASLLNEDAKFPGFVVPMPLRGLTHNYTLLHNSEHCTPLSLPTSLPHQLNSPSPPLAGSSSSTQPTSPPTEDSALRQQNKLITELNKKWNKAFFDEEKRLAEVSSRSQSGPSKKRVRSELVSSNDSYTTSSL